jgi:chorismate mutase
MVKAVRGAIQVAANTPEAIRDAAVRLAAALLEANRLQQEQCVSVLFSVTRDLNKANPASGLRSVGFRDTPLFCVQEAEIEGGMERVIRILLTFRSDAAAPARPVYLDGAERLRPDLASGPVSDGPDAPGAG